MSDRPIEPAEAFALGALHSILRQAKLQVTPANEGEDFDIDTRSFDVFGLVPTMNGSSVCIRITIEEVQ